MHHHLKSLRILFQIAPNQRSLVVQSFLGYLLEELVELLPPIATASIIEVVTDGQGFQAIWIYVVLYVTFYALIFATYAWNSWTYTKLADYYHNYVQRLLFKHIAEHDYISQKISEGRITDTVVDDVRYLVDVLDSAARAFSGIAKLVVIFAVFAYFNIFVAIMAVAIDIIYITIMDYNSSKISRYYDNVRKHEDKSGDILNQMLANLRQVKSLNMMEGLEKKLNRTRTEWATNYSKKRYHNLLREAVIPAIIYGGEILMYIFLAYLTINHNISVGDLVLLVSYFSMVITCTNETLDYLLDLSNYGVRIRRIKAILDYQDDRDFDYGDLNNDYIEGRVVFDRVNYDSSTKKDILKNVSFKAFPNEITAIVGKPGAGKTTIIGLLYRLRHVKSGQITIDDESIYNYSKKVYSKNVSGVFQRPFAFKMSIADNLALADPNHQRQVAVCKRIGIHKTIEKLPKGYHTVIDPTHPLLTHGEIQKLSIARAVLTKAEILLFDEVTSNIDPESTNDIIAILKDLKEDHTIIITTHKPQIMNIADNIVVMENGRVVAKGSNEDVAKRSAVYRNLKKAHFTGPSELED